ncbi:MAG: hypothetical protein RI900_1944 [Actinomycetota bacterium]|jgi:molybdopterin-guanine dinucleotide biosynthesis protein A
MGRDKALVPFHGRPMAEVVSEALTGGGCHRVVAIGGDSAGLAAIGLEVVPDRSPGEGPLGAVVCALQAHIGASVVLVVGCDTPLLDAATVRTVLGSLAVHPTADAAFGRTDRVQPLLGAWRPRCLPLVAEAFEEGERSIHRAMARLEVVEVDVPPESVRNMNTPRDLNG